MSSDMFIVTLQDHPDGVYSVFDEVEDRVIPIFMEEDDADRYLMMLQEDEDYPQMQIVEVDGGTLIDACETRDHKYAIITTDDFLIPPQDTE
ncbi:hypothetical protein S-MbCM7_126 [Synechococcus phage ACG-2014h]|uniref:DUF3110 domain-containing protein n=1 Tax=Synechococcus phage ACG-2014h TaxID=1340810 RepID=V5UT68_9CAUD|nr:hypothetical protein S-MbCM7_126 [Synechococcus phage ACG-2014h]AHB80540.1 hypothetical protein S-MbCM7_126 [Synechococcus phage ACG-2014h]